MSDSELPTQDQRRHKRFPCIGIELLYSPLNNDNIHDVASALLQATSYDMSLAGMAFDIEQEILTGECLLVEVKLPQGETETLTSEVRWCKKLENQLYRVGVSILSIEANTYRPEKCRIETIKNTAGVPSRASFVCPACKQRSWFVLVGNQEGTPYPSILPLYNCGLCQTTRSIPSLLSFNRTVTTEE